MAGILLVILVAVAYLFYELYRQAKRHAQDFRELANIIIEQQQQVQQLHSDTMRAIVALHQRIEQEEVSPGHPGST